LPAALAVLPVRGYTGPPRRMAEQLAAMGLSRCEGGTVARVLRAAGHSPGDYSSKPVIALTPELPGLEAMVRILLHLVRVMRRNEAGIVEDLDTEFVHDFRVAVRRTRSALSQIKKVLPPREVGPFREEFAWLGAQSNRLRDLDVYLLNRPRYQAMLPESLRGGLDDMFRSFARQRRRQLRRVTKVLSGDRYERLVKSWEEFLEAAGTGRGEPQSSSDSAPGADAAVPVGDLAVRLIGKQHRRVLRLGRRITADSLDEELHRLRIQGKKLRYLLEFFVALFPPRQITGWIKQLKVLQDNLGDFNDLAIQQANLESYLERRASGKASSSPQEVAAVGGLVSLLRERRRKVRKEFARTFAGFDRAETRDSFARLRAGAAEPES
jgi:CHAD domain-containing protein